MNIFRELRTENPGRQAESDFADSLIASSHVRRVQIRLTEAAVLASEANDIYAVLEANDPANVSYARHHTLTLRVLSTIQLLRGDWETAGNTLTQSQALRRQRFEKAPTDAQAARDYMAGQLDLGKFHMKEQDFTAAEREFRTGFDALQSLIDDGQLVDECRANQGIFQWYLDGCAMGPIAVGDWEQVLQQPKEKLPHLLAIRCELLVPQRRIGEIAESARFLLQIEPIDPDVLNDAATALANCVMLESGWNGRESFPPESGLPMMTKEQEAKSITFANEALAALRQAKAAGFTLVADNWTNSAFWAIREYPEFLSLCGKSPNR